MKPRFSPNSAFGCDSIAETMKSVSIKGMDWVLGPLANLSESEQLRAFGIGDKRCDNYLRLCYVIERDLERTAAWRSLTQPSSTSAD